MKWPKSNDPGFLAGHFLYSWTVCGRRKVWVYCCCSSDRLAEVLFCYPRIGNVEIIFLTYYNHKSISCFCYIIQILIFLFKTTALWTPYTVQDLYNHQMREQICSSRLIYLDEQKSRMKASSLINSGIDDPGLFVCEYRLSEHWHISRLWAILPILYPVSTSCVIETDRRTELDRTQYTYRHRRLIKFVE
jgi:hypothetical protein